MNFLRSVLVELFGMFVDDGSLAIAVLVWVLIIAGLQRVSVLPPTGPGILLFVGLTALLLENVLRRARRR